VNTLYSLPQEDVNTLYSLPQEDVNTLYSLLNNNNNVNFVRPLSRWFETENIKIHALLVFQQP
jgi:hypothetical protein